MMITLGRNIIHIRVSQNGGSYVLAVDAGREAILSVWQWQWGHLLGKVAVSFFLFLTIDSMRMTTLIQT